MTVSSSRPRGSRATTHFNSKLEKRLVGYITAATAASVGLMAMAQSAEAKGVYTPLANIPLRSLGPVDLNGDGGTDVTFQFQTSGYGAASIAYPAAGNSLIIGQVGNSSGALPLPWRTRIGPNSPFQAREGVITGVDGCHSYCHKFGVWQHQVDKFMGIKFMIAGQPHYGWIRMTVQGALTGYASGYAYEDVPNKPILAGITSGPVVAPATSLVPVNPPQTLGMLARGSDAVAIWRREEEAIAS